MVNKIGKAESRQDEERAGHLFGQPLLLKQAYRLLKEACTNND
jgi:hypothetical protein